MTRQFVIPLNKEGSEGLRAIIPKNLELAYQKMASDKRRESEADIWSEGIIIDVSDKFINL